MPAERRLLPGERGGRPTRDGTRSRADQVYEQLLARIMERDYPEGAKLPAELTLSTELGVSRPVLRQALQHLREDGVIHSQRGSGSYVRRRPDPAMLQFAPVGSIADLGRTFEFRATIEGEAAALAAERWTAAGMEQIEAALATLDRRIAEGTIGADADDAFHLAICAAADNPYFVAARSSLRSQILTGMNVARSLSLTRPDPRLSLVQDEHRAILEAIRRRDGPAARDAMRLHIQNARDRVFEGRHQEEHRE